MVSLPYLPSPLAGCNTQVQKFKLTLAPRSPDSPAEIFRGRKCKQAEQVIKELMSQKADTPNLPGTPEFAKYGAKVSPEQLRRDTVLHDDIVEQVCALPRRSPRATAAAGAAVCPALACPRQALPLPSLPSLACRLARQAPLRLRRRTRS